uniref:NADH-ubiquinone oxidoreductase chain 2 n=1 Tax=Typhlosyrinx sp. MNHN IM 2013-18371 TaxID=2259823 RepID=A0A344H217_9CAEN|nr:NADH dehydrogenase subunit 2 [Typhlosyrinx sp. MNHN IM 2013-18371]AXA45432.1 NADH dehydrogenase subunit 2 [Typhlosyrinx sp. MNHN IM 2013-18371]
MFSSLPFNFMFLITMLIGTMISLSSTHWLGMWIGLEVNLIGFLPMIVYMKKTAEGESAVKYFITQAIGSAFIILGSLLTFTLSFSWDLYNIQMDWSIGIWILLGGLLLKLGLFPFHYWLPSVMAGMSWFSCLILATWQKLAPLFLLVCLLELNLFQSIPVILCLIAVGSSLVGGIGGLNQTQLRALLAYSSIGHLGWMVFSAMMSEWAMKIYLMIYIMISLCLFTVLWLSNVNSMKGVISVGNLYSYYVLVIILLLSLAGLPPLIGFMSKMMVILMAMVNPWVYAIFIMIIGSLMSLFYYLGLLFSMFLSSNKDNKSELEMFKKSSVMSILIIMLNFLGGAGLLMMNLIYYI